MSIVITMLAAATAYQAGAEPAAADSDFTSGVCELVTPTGRDVHFTVSRDSATSTTFTLVPITDSIWPTNSQVATIANTVNPSPFPGELLTIGGQRSGHLLHIVRRHGPLRPATIYLRQYRETLSPVAFGFCQEGAASAERATVAPPPNADTGILSVTDWVFDDSCALIQANGTRSRLQQTSYSGGLRLTASESDLLSGASVNVALTPVGQGGIAMRVSRLTAPDGLSALALDYVSLTEHDGDVGVTLMQFVRFGGTAESSREPGFAICPFRVVRRPRIG
jgi:hypothetical protein